MQHSRAMFLAVSLLLVASPAAGRLLHTASNASAAQLVGQADASGGNRTSAVAAGSNDSAAAGLLHVAKLRSKLTKVSGGLARLLAPSSPLARTESAKPLAALTEAIDAVLNETLHVGANSSAAQVQQAAGELDATLANVRSASMAVSERQVQLAGEDQAQEASLLMGVLMARRHESRARQLEVLNDPQFAELPAVKRVLAANDTRTPLYKQVAIAMDGGNSTVAVEPPLQHNEQPQHVHFKNMSDAVGHLKARIHNMEQDEQRLRQLHDQRLMALNKTALAKGPSASPATKARLRAARKRIDRAFAKEETITEREISSLRDAVAGMESHNISAVESAQKELKATMAAIEAKSGNFIYFIQLVQRASSSDCPYCSAECLENCHASGQSFAACLSSCDDAGK